MTDIIVKPGDYNGQVIQLNQPGQVLKAAPGYSLVRLNSVCEITAQAAGAIIDSTIAFDRPPNLTYAPTVGVNAPGCRVNCEINNKGLPHQGVSLFPGFDHTNLNGLWVHDIGEATSGPLHQWHGLYAQTCKGITGTNIRIERNASGFGLQLYPDCTDASLTQVTIDGAWGGVTFGGASSGNQVLKVLMLHIGAQGYVTNLGSNVCDYVTTPTPGYGYQAAPPAGVTLAQLKMEADAISNGSPAIKKFAQDTVTYLGQK